MSTSRFCTCIDTVLEATLDLARFQSDEARSIAKIGLANYFAGAALMPYGDFLAEAQATRHDLELLSHRFGASIEQIAHRLSTLQRPRYLCQSFLKNHDDLSYYPLVVHSSLLW